MIDDKYYIGFEGEINVDIYYINDKEEQVGYRLWDGYFENMLSGAYYENFQKEGLLQSYCLHEGWYDENHWKISNINIAIDELEHYDENNLENELKNMFLILKEVVKDILELYNESKQKGKDIIIDYDN